MKKVVFSQSANITYLIWYSRKWISLIPGFRVIGIMSRFASEVQMTFIFWSSQWHLKGQKASVPCQVLVALMTNIISAIILAFFRSKLPHSDLESQVYSSKRLLVRKIRLMAMQNEKFSCKIKQPIFVNHLCKTGYQS